MGAGHPGHFHARPRARLGLWKGSHHLNPFFSRGRTGGVGRGVRGRLNQGGQTEGGAECPVGRGMGRRVDTPGRPANGTQGGISSPQAYYQTLDINHTTPRAEVQDVQRLLQVWENAHFL